MKTPEHYKYDGLYAARLVLGVAIPGVAIFLTFVSPVIELRQEYRYNRAGAGAFVAAASVQPGVASTQGPFSAIPGAAAPATDGKESPIVLTVLAQQLKCSEEIKMRIQSEETWLWGKFGLLGALVASVVYRVLFRDTSDTSILPSGSAINTLVSHSSFPVLLAIATCICIIVDMHVRANRVIINENGAWIANYAEPFLYDYTSRGKGPHDLLGWEQFLRQKDSGNKRASYHNDKLFNILYWPEMFSTTAAVYAAFAYGDAE